MAESGDRRPCDGCGRGGVPLVGLGERRLTNVEWLCIDCLEAAVAALGEKLRNFRRARLN